VTSPRPRKAAKKATTKTPPTPAPTSTPPEKRRWRPSVRLTRDGTLFLAGLAGVFYETVFTKADRPTLLLLFAAMMGLPAFLRTDETRKPK
jgi:hypothetical protein